MTKPLKEYFSYGLSKNMTDKINTAIRDLWDEKITSPVQIPSIGLQIRKEGYNIIIEPL